MTATVFIFSRRAALADVIGAMMKDQSKEFGGVAILEKKILEAPTASVCVATQLTVPFDISLSLPFFYYYYYFPR